MKLNQLNRLIEFTLIFWWDKVHIPLLEWPTKQYWYYIYHIPCVMKDNCIKMLLAALYMCYFHSKVLHCKSCRLLTSVLQQWQKNCNAALLLLRISRVVYSDMANKCSQTQAQLFTQECGPYMPAKNEFTVSSPKTLWITRHILLPFQAMGGSLN